MFFTNKTLLLILVGASVFSTACGKKEQAEAGKSETQIVAKVNNDEISIHQVNFQLARMGQVSEAQSKEAAKQILARLVDQQLLKQQALEAKLDRDPRILQAIESSKDEILAQAYLEQLMAKVDKPTKAEIDTFYQEHPELFSNRRIFRLQELVVEISKDKFAEAESGLKEIKGINEIANWLKTKNYPFTANSNVRTAEQLPLELLKKLQTLKDGGVMLVPTDRSLNVLHLAASQSAPISRDKATPIIEQYFLNQNKSNLVKKEITALNTKAKIEYVGAFADMKNPKASQPAQESAKSEQPLASSEQSAQTEAAIVKPSQTAATPKVETKASQVNIDKGLSGL